MAKRTRLSKKFYKDIDQSNATLAQAMRRIQEEYPNIKSCTIVPQPAGYTVYHGEGERYVYVYNGQEMSLEMVSEASLGASNVRHEIGAASAPLPGGSVVLRIWYAGIDGYQLTVYPVGDEKFLEG